MIIHFWNSKVKSFLLQTCCWIIFASKTSLENQINANRIIFSNAAFEDKNILVRFWSKKHFIHSNSDLSCYSLRLVYMKNIERHFMGSWHSHSVIYDGWSYWLCDVAKNWAAPLYKHGTVKLSFVYSVCTFSIYIWCAYRIIATNFFSKINRDKKI